MAQHERGTAYYHLPGLFEFYELYRVFLPLSTVHRPTASGAGAALVLAMYSRTGCLH